MDGAKLSISYAEIAALAFTGRDMAAGKSWEVLGAAILGAEGRGGEKFRCSRKSWSRQLQLSARQHFSASSVFEH